MKNQIFTLKFGINRCYIIKGKGAVLIDGGPPDKGRAFTKILSKYSIDPRDIQLIVLTHGDFDHVGSSGDFKALTGAKILIHEKDRRNLEEGLFNWPPGTTGWGKTLRFMLAPLLSKKIFFPGVKADIILNENEFLLNDFGIEGKIVYTPGHTPGSVSVLLNSGEAFVGCLAHNNFPFKFRPGLPIFAEDQEEVKKSWKTLVSQGAKMIYPAHGNPFPIEKIKKYL
ncbi:MAG: MBL fold metallo-hydrolase [Acidobacteriota bacterium]